jgi:glycosyltransferase involved in cell wall biosynthesis
MKILYVITQGEQGGGQKYVLELAEKVAQEHEVFVGIGRIENEGDKWLFEKLENVGVKKENIFEIKNLQREIKPALDFKALVEMRKLFKKTNPDVVHLNSSKAGVVGAVASIFTKVKVVYTVHGWVFLEPMNPIKKLIYIFLEFISAKLRNTIIFITEKDVQAAKDYHIIPNGIARGSLITGPSNLLGASEGEAKTGGFLIYNGIDESKKENILNKEESRKFIFEKIGKKDEGQKVVGTISNLFKTKGLEYLIDAAKEVRALFVVFGFGDEKYRLELQERINKNNLQEKFFLLGRVPDAYKYLRALDVFTLTSVKEGLPYSILEASLANLPIVATSVGGVPEVANNIKISLVESQNVQQIRSAIIENLNNLEKYKSEFNKIYSLESMVSQTLQAYKNMIN